MKETSVDKKHAKRWNKIYHDFGRRQNLIQRDRKQRHNSGHCCGAYIAPSKYVSIYPTYVSYEFLYRGTDVTLITNIESL